jgi:ParB-like chromosome segregation protein Spo0J
MALALTGPKTVDLKSIKTTFFVRQALNQDHVLMLADLYENDVRIPPPVVDKNLELIDGRHRVEALLLLGRTETPCMISNPLPAAEAFAEALRANMKGALPPTPGDIEYVISLMIERGASIKKIQELLPLPPALTRKYIQAVKRRIYRKIVAQAIESILRDGLTVKGAAEKYNVPEVYIKEVLIKRAKRKPGATYSAIEVRVRSLSQSITKNSLRLVQAYEDGEVGMAEVNEFVKRVRSSIGRLARTSDNIEERMRAMPRVEAKNIEDEE